VVDLSERRDLKNNLGEVNLEHWWVEGVNSMSISQTPWLLRDIEKYRSND